MFVLLEGMERFYVKEGLREEPYVIAKVQIFQDYVEQEQVMKDLEVALFNELRYSFKLSKLLHPTRNFVLSEVIVRNRPYVYEPGVRAVTLPGLDSEEVRRWKFSFAVMNEISNLDSVTKLRQMQEHVLENRYNFLLKVKD